MDDHSGLLTSQLPPRVPRLLLHSNSQAAASLPASVSSAADRPPAPPDDPQHSWSMWTATSAVPPGRVPSEDGSLTYRSISEADHGGPSRDSMASVPSTGGPRTYIGASVLPLCDAYNVLEVVLTHGCWITCDLVPLRCQACGIVVDNMHVPACSKAASVEAQHVFLSLQLDRAASSRATRLGRVWTPAMSSCCTLRCFVGTGWPSGCLTSMHPLPCRQKQPAVKTASCSWDWPLRVDGDVVAGLSPAVPCVEAATIRRTRLMWRFESTVTARAAHPAASCCNCPPREAAAMRVATTRPRRDWRWCARASGWGSARRLPAAGSCRFARPFACVHAQNPISSTNDCWDVGLCLCLHGMQTAAKIHVVVITVFEQGIDRLTDRRGSLRVIRGLGTSSDRQARHATDGLFSHVSQQSRAVPAEILSP